MSNVRPPTSVRLMSGFRFVHEPLATDQAPRFVGRANELQALAERAKFSMKRTESRSSNHEFSFLEYDDKAAESDVLRIARYLTNGFEVSMSPVERFVFKLLGRRIPRIPVKAIFVFDELDKLDEETGDGATKPFLDQLLGDLKNLFTTSGLSFIFVAGKDLYDRWLADVGRGDSVYESVFCYERYLP